jgi:hypothetical protein
MVMIVLALSGLGAIDAVPVIWTTPAIAVGEESVAFHWEPAAAPTVPSSTAPPPPKTPQAADARRRTGTVIRKTDIKTSTM